MGTITSTLNPLTSSAVAALSIIHLIGVNCMYGLVYRNGYIQALLDLKNNGPHVLPGSDDPILTCFTGIKPIDQLLTLAGVMFSNVTDGSRPELSLYGFYFAGQLVSIFTIMTIEGLREGNAGGALSLYVPRDFLLGTFLLTNTSRYPLWGCAMQATGYGFTMPIWSILSLLCSNTVGSWSKDLAKSIRIKDPAYLDTLPRSLIIGYIVPTILMAVPISSNTLHQWLGGLWQGFPVWVALAQWSLKNIPWLWFQASNAKERLNNRYLLHSAYLFAFTLTSGSHLATFGTIAARDLFPSLFPEWARDTLTLKNVFVPPNPQNPGLKSSMAAAIHNFFQYDQYIGSIAALAWASTAWASSRKSGLGFKDWAWLVSQLVGVSLVGGPAGAMIALMWNRDESLLEDDDLWDDN
jgi:hypothetical protein